MIRSVHRLKKALEKAEKMTSVPIEVLIFSGTTKRNLETQLEGLLKGNLLHPKEVVIGVDPVHRHVALCSPPELSKILSDSEIQSWLKALQEDLHMTYFENAIALGVLSLALSLSEKFPNHQR